MSNNKFKCYIAILIDYTHYYTAAADHITELKVDEFYFEES